MLRFAVTAIVCIGWAGAAAAQDVVGIENCSAERTVERRAGCLQSNVNYLHQLVVKNAADAQQKLAAASGEITALRATVARLQIAVAELQAAMKKAEDAAKRPAEPAKKPDDARPK
jgi:hypothetical protein